MNENNIINVKRDRKAINRLGFEIELNYYLYITYYFRQLTYEV